MDIVAFIPARFGSTRLEGKVLEDIGGKPMIQWVYERAKKAVLVGDVTVATDDERVFKAVEAFGGSVVMTSSSHGSGTDRIAEAARTTEADIVVNVQGDEPLIEPDMIDEAIRPLVSDPGLFLCTLKTKIEDQKDYLNPDIVKVVTDKDGFALYFSRSPIPFKRSKTGAGPTGPFKHIGLYVFRKDFLIKFSELDPTPLEQTERLEQLRALEYGYRIKVVETAYNPISVDTPEDLEKIREMVKNNTVSRA